MQKIITTPYGIFSGRDDFIIDDYQLTLNPMQLNIIIRMLTPEGEKQCLIHFYNIYSLAIYDEENAPKYTHTVSTSFEYINIEEVEHIFLATYDHVFIIEGEFEITTLHNQNNTLSNQVSKNVTQNVPIDIVDKKISHNELSKLTYKQWHRADKNKVINLFLQAITTKNPCAMGALAAYMLATQLQNHLYTKRDLSAKCLMCSSYPSINLYKHYINNDFELSTSFYDGYLCDNKMESVYIYLILSNDLEMPILNKEELIKLNVIFSIIQNEKHLSEKEDILQNLKQVTALDAIHIQMLFATLTLCGVLELKDKTIKNWSSINNYWLAQDSIYRDFYVFHSEIFNNWFKVLPTEI